MPSPLVHAATGYAGYSLIVSQQESAESQRHRPQLLLTSIVLACLPDADALVGIVAGDLERAHNSITHSLPFGLLVSSLFGILLRAINRVGFFGGFTFAFAMHTLHLGLDLLGRNSRGLMLLAPFSSHRYRIPFRLFYGVRWDQGLFNRKHLWTLGTETLFVAILLTIILRLRR